MAYNANEPRDKSGKWTGGAGGGGVVHAKAAAKHAGAAAHSNFGKGKAMAKKIGGRRMSVPLSAAASGYLGSVVGAVAAGPGGAVAGAIIGAAHGSHVATKHNERLAAARASADGKNNKVIPKGTHANRTKGTVGPLHHDISKKQRKR